MNENSVPNHFSQNSHSFSFSGLNIIKTSLETISRTEIFHFFQDMLNQGLEIRVKVSGQSMQPFLYSGDVVRIKRVPAAQLHKGDLILFKNSAGEPVLHRVIHIEKIDRHNSVIRTKGDALFLYDCPIESSGYLGKVFQVEKKPFMGWSRLINMESAYWQSINWLTAYLSGLITRIYCLLKNQSCSYPHYEQTL
jgi:signal peptidase I